VQALAPVHETPTNSSESAPPGVDGDCSDHPPPFHTAASEPTALGPSRRPVVTQSDLPAHATPESPVAVAPDGSETLCVLQLAASAADPVHSAAPASTATVRLVRLIVPPY